MTGGIEVRVYAGTDPDELLAVLDRTRGRRWNDTLNDVGTGSFEISAAHPKLVEDPALLQYGNIVRFFYGGEARFAFVVEKKSLALAADSEDAARWIAVSGRGVLSLLETAVVYPAGGLAGAPERTWTGVTAGAVMTELLAEAVARGALPSISWAFTATHGSDATLLSETLDLTEKAGSDLLRIALRHADLAVDVSMTPDLELRYVNLRGEDLTTGAGPLILRIGQGLTGVGLDGVGLPRNTLLLEGPAGFSDRQHAASAATYGRREAFLALGNAQSSDQLTRAADRVLSTQAMPGDSITLGILEGVGPQPYADFNLGDTVVAPDADGSLAGQRVKGLTVSETDDGRVVFTPELSAVHLELELRVARWLKTISEGTVAGRAAAVSSPTPDVGTSSAIDAAIAQHEATHAHPDELDDLDDVDLTGVAAGDVLFFNGGTGKWEPQTPAAPAGLLPWEAVIAGGPLTWANMPAALTELAGVAYWRTLVDATAATEVRLVASVAAAGAAGSVLRAQYSSDEGASWHDLSAGLEPEISLTATGVVSSGWAEIAAGATEPIFVRVVGEDGDGAADPTVVNLAVQFR